jgi:hypothetical protein
MADGAAHPSQAQLYLWPTPGQALLLQAALCPDDGVLPAFQAWREATDLDKQFDWGTFRLLPLVYDRLRALGAEDPLMTRLKGVYRMAWCETQALFHEAAPVVAHLEANGVDTMMLKGAPLALGYYRTPAARPMRDIDFVLRREDARRAIDLVVGLGWTPSPAVSDDEMAYFHSITLRSPTGREIDLHWRCLFEAMNPAADAWFWDTARPFEFAGVKSRQPAPAPMIVHTILHGLRANPEPPIRWIADVMAVLRVAGDDMPWGDLVDFAKAQKVSHRLSLGLNYVVAHHDAPVPSGVLAALGAGGVSLPERIENTVFLGDVGKRRTWLGERWGNLAEYGRFFRGRSTLAAAWGALDYVRVGWKLRRRRDLPGEVVRRAGRVIRRVLF